MEKVLTSQENYLSLVVATLGRTTELEMLLQSLVDSEDKGFEVIIVDQNDDDRLVPIITQYEKSLSLQHLRSTEKNASKARNQGAKSASGNWLGFPDDDCYYTPQTITKVKESFLGFESEVIVGLVTDFQGIPLIHARFKKKVKVNLYNFHTKVCEPSLFLKYEVFNSFKGFNENFGPGRRVPAGEGFDIVIRLLREKKYILFNPSIQILHPRKIADSEEKAKNLAYSYSYGFGCLLAKYKGLWTLLYILKFVLSTGYRIVLSSKEEQEIAKVRLKALFYGFLKNSYR